MTISPNPDKEGSLLVWAYLRRLVRPLVIEDPAFGNLPPRANRITNLVMASLFVPVVVFNAIGESWTYYSWRAVGLELIALALILHLAWVWPRAATASRGWSRTPVAASRQG